MRLAQHTIHSRPEALQTAPPATNRRGTIQPSGAPPHASAQLGRFWTRLGVGVLLAAGLGLGLLLPTGAGFLPWPLDLVAQVDTCLLASERGLLAPACCCLAMKPLFRLQVGRTPRAGAYHSIRS